VIRTPLAAAALAVALIALAAACKSAEEAPPTLTPETTATPTATPTTVPASRAQLAYTGEDFVLWLVDSDGTNKTTLADSPCDGPSRDPVDLKWSPAGDALGVYCSATGRNDLVLLGIDGQEIHRIDNVSQSFWSPDGRYLAYQAGDQEVRMLDLETMADTSVATDAWLLDWPLPHRILVGLNVEDAGLGSNYDAHWLDLGTGETEPVPRFDDMHQFWLSPDASKAVVITPDRANMLAIYDLHTREEKPIAGSVIGFPSEGIPSRQLVISSDGARFYWAEASDQPAMIYRANMDGSGLTNVGSAPSLFVWLSGDGKAAYVRVGAPAPIGIVDTNTGTSVEVAEGFGPLAWRPIP
jgi:WD40 repeat protein